MIKKQKFSLKSIEHGSAWVWTLKRCSFQLWEDQLLWEDFPRESSPSERTQDVRQCRRPCDDFHSADSADSVGNRQRSPVKPLFGLAQEDVSDAKLLLRGISATVNRVFRFFASTLAKNFRRAFEANWANWTNWANLDVSTDLRVLITMFSALFVQRMASGESTSSNPLRALQSDAP